MTKTAARSPLGSLVAHPGLVALLVCVGVICGAVMGRLLPMTYTAEARLAVVSATNNAYTIPGYPLAARELAADYARWVQNRASDGSWAAAGATSVSASPIPESTVIRVEVSARTPEQATAGADHIAATLRRTVAGSQARHDPQRAYAAWRAQMPAVAAARTRTDRALTAYNQAIGAKANAARQRAAAAALDKARVAQAALELKADAAAEVYRRLYADTQGASSLKLIAPAALVGSPARTAMMRYGVLGGLVGGLVALVLAVARDRRDGRVGEPDDPADDPTDEAQQARSAGPAREHPRRRGHLARRRVGADG